MKKITSFLMMFMLFVGMGWAQEEDTRTIVSTLANTQPGKCYTIDAVRGSLVTNQGKTAVTTTGKYANGDKNFAFVRSGSKYYLFSVAAKKFMTSNGSLSERQAQAIEWQAMNNYYHDSEGKKTLTERQGGVLMRRLGDNNGFFNIGGSYDFLINWWGQNPGEQGKHNDMGNVFLVHENGSFDYQHFEASKLEEDGQFGANMHWYFMSLRDNGNNGTYCKLQANGDQVLSKLEYNTHIEKGQLFAFVGNNQGGYEIYNYAAGPNKVLWSTNNGEDLTMMAKATSQKWLVDWNIKDNGSDAGFALKRVGTTNNYMSRKPNGNGLLNYWNADNAMTDDHGRFKIEATSIDVFKLPEAATFEQGYYAISYKDINGTKHFLQIGTDGTFSIVDTPVLFEFSAGVTSGGHANAGAFYLTMNGHRLSRWDSDGSKFLTNALATNQDKCEGIWHCQVISHQKATNTYSIRSTNVKNDNKYFTEDAAAYITHNDNTITATQLENGNDLALCQWNIEYVSPFAFNDANGQPCIYGIKTARDDEQKEWWFSLDQSDNKIPLNQFAADLNHCFFFKPAVQDGQIFTRIHTLIGMEKNWALKRNNENNEAANIVVGPADNSANWVLINKADPFGFQIPGKTNRFLSNNGGKDNKMGIWQDGPNSNDKGSKMSIIELTPEDMTHVIGTFKESQKTAVNAIKVGIVGYPKQQMKDEVLSTIQNATNDVNGYLAITNAGSALYNTKDIVMPEPGKAYIFRVIQKDGSEWYLKSNAAATTSQNGGGFSHEKNEAEAFVCQQVGDKFAFVNNRGLFFTCINNRTNGNAYTENYTEAVNAIKVCAFIKDDTDETARMDNVGNHLLYGRVYFQAHEPNNPQSKGTLVVHKEGSLNVADRPFYNDEFSSGFIMEEVPYANTPKMSTITGDMVKIKDATSIATFSAPFATELPAGVSAYYISNVQSNVATLAKIEGPVLPKNTGVILTGTSEGNVTMVPATEAGAEITSNLLKNTSGAAQPFAANSIFILAKNATKGVGFFYGKAGSLAMNKAYVDAASVVTPAGVNALKLVYGDEVTGIEGVEVEENVNAPIYDLSGRRVMNTVKGGIYIQNGKKFIVK